jgi:hypothetical protein
MVWLFCRHRGVGAEAVGRGYLSSSGYLAPAAAGKSDMGIGGGQHMPFPKEETFVENGHSTSPRRLRTVRQFCQENPAFTIGSIRWLLFHRQTNGLEHAVIKIGRRLLIDEDKFFTWLDVQNEQNER